MKGIQKFCKANDVETSNFTYYRFTINGKKYLVTSDAFLYKCFNGTLCKKFDEEVAFDKVIYASKLRIKEIYRNLKLGMELDERGRPNNETLPVKK